MQHYPDITMCLTIGGRPEVLERTLHSILPQASFAQIIAVNDYRDAASSAVFQRLCPTGLLIVPETQMGHHPIVDRMYSQVQTPYIFHGEDDWFFEQGLDLNRARTLLNADAAVMLSALIKRASMAQALVAFFSTFCCTTPTSEPSWSISGHP